MTEEEIIEIFNNLKEYIQNKIDSGEHKIYYNDLCWDVKCVDCITAIDTLLDLYNKQKEKIISLENQLDFIGEQNKYIDRLEYEMKKKDAYIDELENWTKEHPSVIPMPDEIREEAEKLGHFADLVTIEEKEYISKDKINDKIKELESHIWKDGYMTKFDEYAIHYLNELLEER